MQRRRFLQLAAGAAAGAAVWEAAPGIASFQKLSLRLGKLSQGTLVLLTGNPLLTRSTLETPPGLIEMIWERPFGSADEHSQWLINGRPYSEREPLLVQPADRYRLRMMNATGQKHSVYMQQHRLQLTRVDQTKFAGPLQEAIVLERYTAVDADIVVKPGDDYANR